MLNTWINQIALPLDVFVSQTILWVGKLILAYIIWLIGIYFIKVAISLLDKADIKNWNIDDKARQTIKMFLSPVAKFVLILVILDTLGIGSNIVLAIMNGLTFTVSIALGLAFGKALEPFANEWVSRMYRNIQRK